MDLEIAGKTAIVFGASRGLGRAVANSLGREGCRVVALARSLEALDQTVAEISATGSDIIPITCDVSSKTSIQEMIANVKAVRGAPEILVYNNGGPADSAFSNATDQEFIDGFTTQIMGYLWAVREVIPDMKARGWGRLVTLGSMAAKEPHREMPLIIHNVLRPAAVGLSKSLSVELARFGITVNTIGTGLIDGGEDNSFRKTVRGQAESLGVPFEELLRSRLQTIPVGRGGRPDEVGALCAFLCSQSAAFMTGQTLILDGGKVRTLY